MKPVMKDGKRQARRERTLARLELYLAGGVKMKGKFDRRKEYIGGIPTEPFTPADIKRIEYDIKVLRERLGKAPAGQTEDMRQFHTANGTQELVAG